MRFRTGAAISAASAGSAGTAAPGWRAPWRLAAAILLAVALCPAAPALAAQARRVPPAGAAALMARPSPHGQPGFRRIVLPDLLIVAPRGLSRQQLSALAKVQGVRGLLAADGAEISVAGHPASVIGVSPDRIRSWMPLRTGSDERLWAAVQRGDLIASAAAASRLRLRPGASYRVSGGAVLRLRLGATGQLGIAGVDLLVNQRLARSLGLVRQVAALVSAPGADLTGLLHRVRRLLGPSARIVDLRPQQAPATPLPAGQLPTTYLQLFRASAATYCPGLSWTVLAAIGQIESGDGRNNGPSSAGALGPMQFLPSTWAVWGTRGFGVPGAPDIMNPYDAVPSAARMLCADGAAAGGASLRQAIFDYNHATWYVNEVLALAGQYAASYP
jgi:hypothetical protein